MGQTTYLSCVPCDGRAAVLMVPGRTESFGQILRQSLLMPAGGTTLLLIIGSLLLIHLARSVSGWLVPGVLALIGMCIFMGILQLSSRGTELTGVQTLDVADELLLPAGRLWLLTLPLAWGLMRIAEASAWMAILLVILMGGVLAPLWCLSAGRGDGLVELLAPKRLHVLARKLGADGTRLGLLMALLTAVLTWWWHTSRSAGGSEFDFLSLVLDAVIALGILMGARLLGTLAAARADALDVPFRSDLLKPALPGARPAGIRKPRPAPAPVKERPKFIEL